MGNKEQNTQAYKRWRSRLRAKIDGLKQRPCQDCQRTYHPFVMDFDHRPGETKEFNISAAVPLGQSWVRVETEIAKCDVVCANCHRMRTLMRKGEEAPSLIQRPTHCPKGHEYTPENTKVRVKKGRYLSRECVVCIRAADRERGARRSAARRQELQAQGHRLPPE